MMRCVSSRIKKGIKRDAWSVDRESTCSMNAQQQKVAFAINAAHNSIPILNAKKCSILSLIASIAEKEDTLRENARPTRRGFTRKEDHVSDVGQWDTH